MPVKIVKKVTIKKVKSVIASKAKQSKKEIATKPSASRNDKLSIPVYSLLGNAAGNLSLPKEVFGKEVNKRLLAQAIRVYLTNQKQLLGKTKSRGEVEGSTAKIYRQKGTGRARHGGIRAPIFVGGGTAFGPQSRKVRLDLPKKMKRAALFSALSSKVADKQLVGISGLEKASGKTKEISNLIQKISGKQKVASSLIITGENINVVVRAARNIKGLNIIPVNQVNAYHVLKHHMLLITKEAVEGLGK